MNFATGTAPAPSYTPSRADRGLVSYYLTRLDPEGPALSETHPADDARAEAFIDHLWVMAETGAANSVDAPGYYAPAGPDPDWVNDEAAKRVAQVLLTLSYGLLTAAEAAGFEPGGRCACGQWPVAEYGRRCPSCPPVA